MPLSTIRNLHDVVVTTHNPLAGTPAGSRVQIASPVRGRLIEAGFVPCSLVTSGMTLAVATNLFGASSTASNFVQCVTSTLGTFSSTNLFEGAVASVVPPSPVYVNPGDAIQLTTSGGQDSTVGATLYAIIKKG